MQTQSTVAIIGLGNIGKIVAGNLAKSNTHFLIAERNTENVKQLAQSLNGFATAIDIASAVKQADILILAIPFPAIKTFFQQYGAALSGKIIVDPSNPIALDEKGGFSKIIGQDESAGELNAAALPAGAKLVKALGTLGAASLASAAFQSPELAVLFYATNDTNINVPVEQLISNMGFAPLRVGGIDQSIRIEAFGDLHEYGALGKTVTVKEAEGKI